jgi:hypothetical protein
MRFLFTDRSERWKHTKSYLCTTGGEEKELGLGCKHAGMLVPCSTGTLCRLQVQVYALARNTPTSNQVLRLFGLVVLPNRGDPVL